MTSDDLDDVTENLREFSLINKKGSELRREGSSYVDFQDILLSLASIFRKKDMGYEIEYERPDKPVFRLRSDTDFSDDVREEAVNFSEPGRQLHLKTDNPGTNVFEGLLRELKILGNLEFTKEDEATREPELNLLVSRTFQAELFSEYQRWKRYETPFLIALAHLKQDDEEWEPVGRAFKHVSKTRDIIGYLGEGRVAGFFPSIYDKDSIKEDLSERLSARYDTDELELSFFTVPDDFDDWNSLKKRVFSPIYLTETRT